MGIFRWIHRGMPFRVYIGMKKKSYIFTNKKHSERAIMATILGIISIVSLAAAVSLSYAKGGEVPGGYGVAGLLATIFSLIGLGLGVVTAREKKYYKLFPWLGVILNLAALAAVSMLLYMGSRLG